MRAQAHEPEAGAAIEEARKNFDFGKWKKLSEKSPITYCRCQISILHGETNLDAEEYLKQVKPIAVDKNGAGDMTDREVSLWRSPTLLLAFVGTSAHKVATFWWRQTRSCWRVSACGTQLWHGGHSSWTGCAGARFPQKPKHVRQQRTS